MIETIKKFDNNKDAAEYATLFSKEIYKYNEDNGNKIIAEKGSLSLMIEDKNKKIVCLQFEVSDSPYEDERNNNKEISYFTFTASNAEKLNEYINYLKTRPIADLYSTTKQEKNYDRDN